jgi:hypothetical protein
MSAGPPIATKFRAPQKYDVTVITRRCAPSRPEGDQGKLLSRKLPPEAAMSCELNSTGNAQPLEISSAVPAFAFHSCNRSGDDPQKLSKAGAPCFTEH